MFNTVEEHMYYLADEISRLEAEAEKNKYTGFINGFVSAIITGVVIWLVHH